MSYDLWYQREPVNCCVRRSVQLAYHCSVKLQWRTVLYIHVWFLSYLRLYMKSCILLLMTAEVLISWCQRSIYVSDVQDCQPRLSSALDLLLIFLCSLIQTLTLTPPPNDALLANLDMYELLWRRTVVMYCFKVEWKFLWRRVMVIYCFYLSQVSYDLCRVGIKGHYNGCHLIY